MLTQIVMCADALTWTPNATYDVMICDPPYSDHVHKNAVSLRNGGVAHRDLEFAALTPELRAHIAKFAANVRKWSLIYSDIEGLHDWRLACAAVGATYIRPIPWIRWSMPQLSGDRPPVGCEFVTAYWGAQGGRKSWNGPGNLTHLAHLALRGKEKHKAEKPLDQALDLVQWFSDPGDLVFDPCAGSGTVGCACRLLGRGYVGLEISPQWAQHANDRISRALDLRDEERYRRWRAASEIAAREQMRRDAYTARVRTRLAQRAQQKTTQGKVGDQNEPGK